MGQLKTTKAIKQIGELVDIIAMEKPLDWESLNYEASRDLAIASMIEQYSNLKSKTPDIADESIISIMSYMMLENMMLWVEIQKMKHKYGEEN